LFKGIATGRVQPLQEFYPRWLAKPIQPTLVLLTQARKMAAIHLALWKKGANFDVERLKSQVNHRCTSKVGSAALLLKSEWCCIEPPHAQLSV
jgi:hypothetical protein